MDSHTANFTRKAEHGRLDMVPPVAQPTTPRTLPGNNRQENTATDTAFCGWRGIALIEYAKPVQAVCQDLLALILESVEAHGHAGDGMGQAFPREVHEVVILDFTERDDLG